MPRDLHWRRRPRFWTPERLWRLSELLERGWDDERIGREFGKSAEAVRLARTRHGLAPRTQQAYTARRVAELLGIPCAKTVTRWIQRGWLRAHRGPRIGPHRHYMVRHENLIAFLEDERYWHLWDPERIDPASGFRRWAQEIRAGVRFLTVGDVAERCYVEVHTVSNWIRSGRLPAVRNGNWLVRERDLDGFIPPGQLSRSGIPQRRFTRDEDQRLLAMRAAGIGWTAIARELGRPVSSVFGRYRRLMGRYEEEAAA